MDGSGDLKECVNENVDVEEMKDEGEIEKVDVGLYLCWGSKVKTHIPSPNTTKVKTQIP